MFYWDTKQISTRWQVCLCESCAHLPQWNTAFTSRLSDKNKSGFRLRAYEADKSSSHYVSVGPTHSLYCFTTFHCISSFKIRLATTPAKPGSQIWWQQRSRSAYQATVLSPSVWEDFNPNSDRDPPMQNWCRYNKQIAKNQAWKSFET